MMVVGVIVMWAMLAALVLCAALWPLARHADRRGRPGLLRSALSNLRRLTLTTLLALSAVFTISVAYSGKNTNSMQNVGGQFLMQFTLPQAVTPQDFSNGWRVVEETGAESFAQPSANAVTNERWRLRGAHDDAFRIAADGWSYSSATGVTVLSRGELRTSIHAHDFPRAFDQDLSLVPVINCPLLPEGRRESFFWHDATPSNTLLTTWWNAALGRDVTNPVNFQAELFPNGMFTYRYEDRTVRHVRVWPFDWDDDGLENSVDPDPLTAGPDAHGTNAEWYNTVCSNALEAMAATSAALPPELTWREGVNSNAYYFVDVVTVQGPAPIYFTGDRDSRLGNPVVVARGGETNRVPLLIGIDYAITSIVPFTVSFPEDDGFAVVTTNGVANYEVRWPLEFSVIADGNGYRVVVGPYDPGCEFQWPIPTRSATCSYTTDGNWIGFSCCGTGSCECDGCSVAGVAMLDDTPFYLPDVWCGCWHYDPLDPGIHMLVTNGPSVSVSFDKSVVFYEDSYTNAPNDVVAKHSTNITLTVFAYGGDAGSMLYVSEQKIGKLVRVGGKAISFPYAAFVPPNGGMSFSIEYEAETHSDSENDISVTASLMARQGVPIVSRSARLTTIQVEIQAETNNLPTAPVSRHVFGVGETVKCYLRPDDVVTSLFSGVDITWQKVDEYWAMSMPYVDTALPIPLRLSSGDENFLVSLQCLVPTNVVAISAEPGYCGGTSNKAGFVSMSCLLELHPKTVSFAGHVILREVPATGIPSDGTHEGYFASTAYSNQWYHMGPHGAGNWCHIEGNNLITESDTAWWSEECPPPWSVGTIVWRNPIAWRPASEECLGDEADRVFCYKPQTFRIDDQGVMRVEKFNHEVHRAATGDYWCDGVWIEWLSRMEKGE